MSKNQRTQKSLGGPIIKRDKPNRRRFLIGLSRGSLVAAAVLVIDQITRFLSFQPSGGYSTVITLGLPQDFPSGALTYAEAARAYVGRDERGLYALDAVCTHLGCLVEMNKNGAFTCPCHGSRFDAHGQAQSKPATKPLRYLQLWLEHDGQLIVDRAQPVEPAARLVV